MRLRPYRGWEDLAPMQRILAEGLRDAPDRSYVHPGDVAWWIGWRPRARSQPLGSCTALWEESGRVLGWAIVDEGDAGEFVAPEILDTRAASAFFRATGAWLGERDEPVVRYAFDTDTALRTELHDQGWKPTEGGLRSFRKELQGGDLAPGDVVVRALEPSDDPSDRCAVTHAAFDVDLEFGGYVEEYRRFMRSPAYPAGWDLVAESPDGVAAACCIAWPDPVSRVGNFEPVASHPDFRRRGYAKAAMAEGLRRLHAEGMTSAIVRTGLDNPGAQALYLAIGFQDSYLQRAFERPG